MNELFGGIGSIIVIVMAAIVIACVIFAVYKKSTGGSVKAKKAQIEDGIIAELAGVHWYGLPANEGAKVFIDLCEDRITFRAKGRDILSIAKEQVIAITSRTEKEIISSITKGTTKGGLGAAAVGGALLGPVGMLTGAMVGKKRQQSETKTKTKKNLYFVLKNNTQYGEIALMVKSKGKLRRFVDMCNSALLR
jgi:hypothetical protein